MISPNLSEIATTTLKNQTMAEGPAPKQLQAAHSFRGPKATGDGRYTAAQCCGPLRNSGHSGAHRIGGGKRK